MRVAIRPIHHGDFVALIALWHQAWHEAHAHLVPAEILAYRTLDCFSEWFAQALCEETFYVAVSAGEVLGFVSIGEHEVARLFVRSDVRGTRLAHLLLSHAESELAATGCRTAKLYCIAGNTPAEKFYAREGWTRSKSVDEPLWLPEGAPARISVATHLYEKALA